MTATLEIIPTDKYNETLRNNVHPPNWQNPTPPGRYNLIAIGAGAAGLVTSAIATGLGARTALIERHLLGGDCLNVGCVPSKALIRSAHAVHDARQGAAFGLTGNEYVKADFPAVMERMRRLRAQISPNDSAARFTEKGVDVYLGDARFTGPDTVEVDGQTLQFKRAVICTGARAWVPPIDGLQEAGYLTNETVFSLTALPARLAVIGGGPIGCELAQAFRRFGADVTIISNVDQFLPREDADAARILYDQFQHEDIDVCLDANTKSVAVTPDGKEITLEINGETRTLTVDEILVGAGRAPNVNGLGLEAAGVEFDERRGVHVDDRLRTSNPKIFAAGDCCMQHKFTHAADAAARIVIANALFHGRQKLSALTIPWCTYTDPEIAHVGLYEKDARERGIELDTFTVQMSDVDRAITDGEDNGFVKIHVQKGKDKILGATIVGRQAGSLISEITLAIVNNICLGKISGVIHPYPTQAEGIKRAADAYGGTRLTPTLKKWFARWFAWNR